MVVVGARAAAALGAAAVVVGGLPIALPAQLRALGGSVARVDRRLQAVESMDILGTIQQESVAPNPENVRATCYMGLIEEVTTKCNLLDDDGEEVPPGVWYYEKTEGWNMSPRGESDVLCLQCCSQLYDEPNERIHEEWNFDCAVDATVRTKFDTGYYGYEFRFARNRDEKDDKMVRCAMGRIGCEYEGIFGEYEMDGRPLSCTSKQADGDYGSCSADNSSCVCEIPGSQRGARGPTRTRTRATTTSTACGAASTSRAAATGPRASARTAGAGTSRATSSRSTSRSSRRTTAPTGGP